MARNPFTGQALKELSELDAALTIAQMNTLAEVVPGTGAASKALVLDANGNVTIPAATIAALIATSFAYNAAVTRTATATGAVFALEAAPLAGAVAAGHALTRRLTIGADIGQLGQVSAPSLLAGGERRGRLNRLGLNRGTARGQGKERPAHGGQTDRIS